MRRKYFSAWGQRNTPPRLVGGLRCIIMKMIGEINCVSIYLYRSERVETQAASSPPPTPDYTQDQYRPPILSGPSTPYVIFSDNEDEESSEEAVSAIEEIDMQQLAELNRRLQALDERTAADSLVQEQRITSVRDGLERDLVSVYLTSVDRDAALNRRVGILERDIGIDPNRMDIGRSIISRLEDVEGRAVYIPDEANKVAGRVETLESTVGDLTREASTEKTQREMLQTNVRDQGIDISSLRGRMNTLSTETATSMTRLQGVVRRDLDLLRQEVGDTITQGMARLSDADQRLRVEGTRRLRLEERESMRRLPVRGGQVPEIEASPVPVINSPLEVLAIGPPPTTGRMVFGSPGNPVFTADAMELEDEETVTPSSIDEV